MNGPLKKIKLNETGTAPDCERTLFVVCGFTGLTTSNLRFASSFLLAMTAAGNVHIG